MPWARLAGAAVLALLGLLDGHVSELTLAICAGVAAIAVAASDRLFFPLPPQATARVGAD